MFPEYRGMQYRILDHEGNLEIIWCLDQQIIAHGLNLKSGQQSPFVDKVSLEHSHPLIRAYPYSTPWESVPFI